MEGSPISAMGQKEDSWQLNSPHNQDSEVLRKKPSEANAGHDSNEKKQKRSVL